MLGNLPADYKRQEQKAIKQGKDYDKPYVAIPRNFNKAMGVLNNVLGVGASTALRIADFLEDPLNLDPETPGRTEILTGLAGEAAQEGLNRGEDYLINKGVHPTHVESLGHAAALADLFIGSRGSGSAAKAASTIKPSGRRLGSLQRTISQAKNAKPLGQAGEVISPGKVKIQVKPKEIVQAAVSRAGLKNGAQKTVKAVIENGNGFKNGKSSTKVSSPEDVLNKSIDRVRVEIESLQTKQAGIKPSYKTKGEISELGSRINELSRTEDALNTMLVELMEIEQPKLFSDLDNALIADDPLALVRANTKAEKRAMYDMRVPGWNWEGHHKGWLNTAGTPFKGGRVNHETRHNTLQILSDQYDRQFSHAKSNIDMLFKPAHLDAHFKTWRAQGNRVGLEMTRRLMALGENATAEQIAKTLSKVRGVMDKSSEAARTSKANTKPSWDAFDNAELSPSFRDDLMKKGFNPADPRDPLLKEVSKQITAQRKQIEEAVNSVLNVNTN